MNDFLKTLSGTDKVLYQMSYDFELKYSPNATPESAHLAGLEKLANTKEMMAQLEGEQDYVNVATGERFRCTENQLIAKYS